MTLIIQAAAAQMRPIAKPETRKDTVRRLSALLRRGKERGTALVVFTEMAFTTFLPRRQIEDEAELDSYSERGMPGPETQPLFDEAGKRRVSLYLGSAGLVVEEGRKGLFNTSIPVNRNGKIIGRYSKVKLPVHADIDGLTSFHNHLSMQARAYQNAAGVIGTAKCGKE
ncbi:nitrilase-related carbon-nitrogen hydrolase [Aestuariivirga sp.]|uniref:nitrilase-related carbon-nitrogen hydrolase n=1 Tax=Aestuariivirga sp. TaxID=2650926 RepID=UPI003593E67D